MGESRTKRFIKNILYPFILESLVVFLVLFGALAFEFHSRNLLNQEVLIAIAKNSLRLTLLYLVIFRLAKSGILIFTGFVSSVVSSPTNNKQSLFNYLTDVFITLLIILTTTPIRPILQKVYTGENGTQFDQGFAKFDAIPTIAIFSIIGLPLLALILRKYSGFTRIALSSGLMAAIIIAGYINNKPNYDARIFESRASWINRDWEKEGVDAAKALADAKTDQEKAVAYYWLGVSAGRQGKYAEDITYQTKAVALDPTWGAPHSSLSLMYVNTGNLELAKQHADKCIELEPDYAWCYYALAAYLDHAGDRKGAYKYLNKAIELDPDAIDFQNTLKLFKINNPGIEDQ
jgi:tetratricopeptide (TPR) repeat protein